MAGKIDELVDAVNGILDYAPLEMATKAEPNPAENVPPDAESRPVNVQDKFAEQRKWRHKLCWFWNDGCADYIGILYEIHDLDEIPFENDLGEKYQHCRPVKPDDDIIYKGGDNE